MRPNPTFVFVVVLGVLALAAVLLLPLQYGGDPGGTSKPAPGMDAVLLAAAWLGPAFALRSRVA
jgi:hypothetical protein